MWLLLATSGALLPAPQAASLGDDQEAIRSQFQHRKSRLLSDDSIACMTLGSWAAENGLFTQADDLYREWLVSHPDDIPVYDAITRLWANRPPPTASKPRTDTRELLPTRFVEYSTQHFVVLSDASRTWTRGQAAHLERAQHQFRRFVRRLGLHHLPLGHKLVCVLFDKRFDYREFARQHDGVSDPNVAGYYSPASERLVFYNPANNPSVNRVRDTIDGLEQSIDQLHVAASEAHQYGYRSRAEAIRHKVSFYEARAEQERSRMALFIDETSIATTIHEAIHHLAFTTRVQTPYVQYPLWISEGLATSFETGKPKDAFGPDHEYLPRRTVFRQLQSDEQLIPLESLVQIIMLPSRGNQQSRAVYNQSYALIAWMSRFRRTELRNYLGLMRDQKPGRLIPEHHLQVFEEAFGDVEQLERSWLRHERATLAGLPSPYYRNRTTQPAAQPERLLVDATD